MSQYFTQPFGITWRKALLSAPRLVPDAVLHILSPEGPHPIVINLPSRSSHLIPVYIFIPPSLKLPRSPNLKQPQNDLQKPKLPVLIDFHGGGFIFGSCQEQAPFCAKMSRDLTAIVISVDYRLGPAAQFPAAIEDAEDVLHAILSPLKSGYEELRGAINGYLKKEKRGEVDIDQTRIAVSGFSSGGNLALNLGLSVSGEELREWGGESEWPSVFGKDFKREIPMLLFYPSLDARQLPSERPRPPGMEEKKPGYFKSLNLEGQLMLTYLPREKAGHPRASPGLVSVKGGLHEQARMLLVLPEWDTLAEQSEVWVQKVGREGMGKDLTVERARGVVHGWTQFPDSWLGEEGRRLKGDVFEKAREFVARCWA